MIDTNFSEQRLVEQFLKTLESLPDVQALPDAIYQPLLPIGLEHDPHLQVQIRGREIKLLTEVKKSVYPRDVQQLLWQIESVAEKLPKEKRSRSSVPFIVAEWISSGAKELLRKEGVGYYDAGGSLFLSLRGIYIFIEKPSAGAPGKSVRSLFLGRRAQVLHALLIKNQEWFSVKTLAEYAQVAPSTASEVLTELDRFEWMSSQGHGPHRERRLTDPASLLDAWVKQLASIRAPKLQRYYVPSRGADSLFDRIGQCLDEHQVKYAFTHEVAAQRYTPFLSNVSQMRVRLLPGPTVENALGKMGARIVNEGSNFAVIEAKSDGEFLFSERVGNAWLASPIQVYLDLLRGEGRAKEMAEHLRKEKIGF